MLIVEDQEVVRLGIKVLLERAPDMQLVGEACDGRLGVEKVLELRPQVTVMDIGLPVFDGIAACKLIKDQWPDARIVMLTAHESKEYIFASLSAGANGYCVKSLSGDNIVMAIRTVASGAAWLDPAIAERMLGEAASLRVGGGSKPGCWQGVLSSREEEVLRLVVEGLSNAEMAERLCVSLETVKTHMRHIMEKLSVSDRTQAAVNALRAGWI